MSTLRLMCRVSFLMVLASALYMPTPVRADHRIHSYGHSHSHSHSSRFGVGVGIFNYSNRFYGGGLYPGWSYGYPYSYGYGGIGPSVSLRVYSGPSYYRPYTSSVYPVGVDPVYIQSRPNYVVAPTTIETTREVILESERPAEPTDGGPIVIYCPAESTGSVSYTINGHRFTMKPGQSQKFTNDRRWIVEFDQGAGRGLTKYTLNSGHFKFKQTPAGWDFVQTLTPPESGKESAPPPPMDTPNPLLLPQK